MPRWNVLEMPTLHPLSPRKHRLFRTEPRRAAFPAAALGCWLALAPLSAFARAPKPAPAPPDRARQLVAEAIAALGGPAYLHATFKTGWGRVYSYNGSGELNGYGTQFWSFTAFPGKQRVELTKKRDIFYIYNGPHAWQVTYRGAFPLNREQMRDYTDVDAHSLGRVLRQWADSPGTLMIARGLSQASGQQLEQVDLISPQDLTVHLSLGLYSHLPQQLSWSRRDRLLGILVPQKVIYGNYQRVDGVMTPMMVQRYAGTQPVVERIYYKVQYPPSLDAGLFTPPKKLPK